MVKLIRVETCSLCPHLDTDEEDNEVDNFVDFCGLTGRVMRDPYAIPTDCPLPDAPEEAPK